MSKVDAEVDYLKSTGRLSVTLGSFIALYRLDKASVLPDNAWFTALGIGLLMYLIYEVVKNLKLVGKIKAKAFWLGTFEDEFSQHVYDLANRVGLGILGFVILAFAMLDDLSWLIPQGMSIAEFCQILAAIWFLSMGITIVKGMRDTDED